MAPGPEGTVRVAHAACPGGPRSRRVREELGPSLTDGALAPLFAGRGRPAAGPWRLAWVPIVQ